LTALWRVKGCTQSVSPSLTWVTTPCQAKQVVAYKLHTAKKKLVKTAEHLHGMQELSTPVQLQF